MPVPLEHAVSLPREANFDYYEMVKMLAFSESRASAANLGDFPTRKLLLRMHRELR